MLPDHTTGIEKWQSHCSEKVTESDFSKGTPKSRNQEFAPLCSEIATFAENVRFMLPGEPVAGHGMLPPGDPKNHENSMFFRKKIQWSLGGRRAAKVSSRTPPGTEKVS